MRRLTDAEMRIVAGRALIHRMRLIADLVEVWDMCGRPACRRARSCRDATIACFDVFAEPIRGVLTELAEWERLDGPLDEGQMAVFTGEIRAAIEGKERDKG